jgi:hypothetical protein
VFDPTLLCAGAPFPRRPEDAGGVPVR